LQAFPRIWRSVERQFSPFRLQFWLLAVAICLTPARALGQVVRPGSDQGQTTKLLGQVVDGRTGAPLEQVLVTVEDAGKAVQTDAEGRFELSGLVAGPHRIYVSVVGYALFRKDVEIPAQPLTIRLSEGTTAYSETLTVTPDAFRAPPDPVPSASILGSAELLNLRGVLADDPLRAVQVLPGVATGDDLRSEFTVRGSDFRHLTFTVDGFATPYLLHTVRGVEDRGPTGSVAMINSDVLSDVSLLNGGYPQHYGGHTGAEVDFRTREGARDRRIFRVSVSGTSASAVAEGPIGRAGRGSWLVSGRQSYIDHLVRHLTAHSVSFGFADAQARAAYDLSPSQHLDVTVLTGHSRFLNEPGQHEIDDVYDATNAAVVAVAGWRLTRSRVVFTQRLLAAENHFRNENQSDVELDHGKDRQLAYRADATIAAGKGFEFAVGGEGERRDDARVRRRLAANRVTLAQLDDYTADAVSAGGYASVKWTPRPSLTIAPGMRADHWTLTRQSTASPWLQGEWRAGGGLTVRAAAGRYQQFPDFDKVLGASGGEGLAPERATQYDAGVERRISPSLRVSATLYDRQEDDMLRRPGAETRVVNGRGVRGLASARYENRLEGFARGVEVMLQRSVAGAGVSGWLSYAYGRNRYHDLVSHETFWGDSDQRHTMNAYALYRYSDRTSFVAKLRVGSNFPIPGYYAKLAGTEAFTLSDVRNTERLPVYARLDLRANRAFNWSRRRLTLFAEVINVFNRANYRFEPPSINIATRSVSAPFDSMFPVIPSVGCLFEF
jgi:ferric enterobactin receptor